jgi:hypothetical protein
MSEMAIFELDEVHAASMHFGVLFRTLFTSGSTA